MSHRHGSERRLFLKLSARLAALGLTSLGVGPSRSLFSTSLQASTAVTDYKALVCIYLFGGSDMNNAVVPLDSARYTAYQSLRGSLALSPSRLLSPIADTANQPYGLHSSLAALHTLYESGQLAVVLNMGMLTRPLTKTQYQQGADTPANLFSHSDQTTQAQTAQSQQVASGWGGRLLEAFGTADPLSAVSVSSPALFLDGQYFRSNVIPPGSNLALSGLNIWPSSAGAARRQAVEALLALDGGHALRRVANDTFADGLQLGDSLAATGSVPALTTAFPTTSLGTQLKEVARLVRLRARMGPGRQVFFCSMGGFDTHTGQDGTHTSLLQQLAQAMAAFHAATVEAGLAGQVTTFTQSEFSRTMQPNGSGTDHAWGSHQFVLGGAVRGGIYGALPTLALGGPDDTGTRGVWIPTISTAQFGATLGKWFGASSSELAWAFPTLGAFATPDIGFMG